MKKIKYLALLLSVATFLSVVGIGFAIWYNVKVILPNGDGTVTGDSNKITAYSVDKSSNILKCDDISMFSYSALSFSGNNGTGTGTIEVTYWIDMNSEFITDSTTLTFSLTYEEGTIRALDANDDGTNDGLFGEVTGTTKTFSAAIGSVGLGNATVSTDGKTISFTCTYGAIKNQITNNAFTLTYTLTIPETYTGGTTVGNFRKAFGQYLLSNWDSDGDGTGDTTTKFIVIAEAKLT